MKSVLLSIRPGWCALIVGGEKTMEVRKTRPNINGPFKCYIYCTLAGTDEFFKEKLFGKIVRWNREGWSNRKGNVIGEFVCNSVTPIHVFENGSIQDWMHNRLYESQIEYEEMAEYIGNGKTGYGWHISDLVIYDKPKKLSEFTGLRKTKFGCAPYELKRPPQSWCYAEEVYDGT